MLFTRIFAYFVYTMIFLGEAVGGNLNILIPAYIYPTDSSGSTCQNPSYLKLADAGSLITAIVNPNNGPVSSNISSSFYSSSFISFENCFNLMRSSGNSLLGYVSTKNSTETSAGVWEQTGFRSLTDIEIDLSLWHSQFDIDGIFLDEVSNLWQVTEDVAWGDHVAFYLQIFAMIDRINSNWTIAINPGSAFSLDLFAAPSSNRTADIALVYESSASGWDPTAEGSTCLANLWTSAQGSYSPGPWCPYVPVWDGVDIMVDAFREGTFEANGKAGAVTLYGANSSKHVADAGGVESIIAQAVRWNMSYVYITDSPQATPWASLPSNFDTLVAMVEEFNAGSPTAAPSPVPTTSPVPMPTSLPTPTPTTLLIPVPTPLPVPTPTTQHIPVPTPLPVPTPTTQPIPVPTPLPVPTPTTQPIPVPTPVPVATPTALPIPVPSNLPTMAPTASDTVSITSSFTLTAASSPTATDKTNLKQTIADSLNVTVVEVKNFVLSSEVLRRTRRGLLTSSWSANFEVTVSLSATTSTSSESYSVFVATMLAKGSFTSRVTANTAGAVVDTSSIVTVVSTRYFPTSVPVSLPTPPPPTLTPTPPEKKKKDNTFYGVDGASFGIALVGLMFFFVVGIGALCYIKSKNADTHDDNKEHATEMTPKRTPTNITPL